MYRGHMYLWQDNGPFGVFDPDDGWCRAVNGAEPGGVKGVVCDVIPDGMDLVGWLGVGFMVILLTGFYLWYWPGVKRWANALRIQRSRGRFTFNMSLHKVDRIPRVGTADRDHVHRDRVRVPEHEQLVRERHPAQRDFYLWTPSDDSVYSSEKPEGTRTHRCRRGSPRSSTASSRTDRSTTSASPTTRRGCTSPG